MKTISILFILLFLSPISAFAEETPAAVPQETVTQESPFTLERCIALALRQNYDIRQARERIQRQYGVVVSARSALFPHLAWTADYRQIDKNRIPTTERDGQLSQFGSDKSWTTDVTVAQNFFAGGRDIATLEQQRLLREAAEFDLESVANQTLLTVSQRFYNILLSREQIRVQEQNVQLLEEELRYEKNRFAAGTVSDFNVLRAEVELANSRTPLIRAQNSLPIAFDQLRQVLGLEAGPTAETGFDITGALKYQPVQIKLDEAIVRANTDRPEMKNLSLNISAAEQSIKAARAGYWPTFAGTAGYGADKSETSPFLNNEVHGWSIGLAARWNIFDSFQTEGEVTQAESSTSLARLARDQERLAIEVEVRQAHSALTEANALVLASQKVVAQAEESLRLARARFDAGTGTQLDVLNSQVALTQARTNQAQALYDFNVARASMEKAIGKPLK